MNLKLKIKKDTENIDSKEKDLTNDHEDFFNKINSFIGKVVSHVTFGGFTEYYDEDGVVLFTVKQAEDSQTALILSDGIETFNIEFSESDLVEQLLA